MDGKKIKIMAFKFLRLVEYSDDEPRLVIETDWCSVALVLGLLGENWNHGVYRFIFKVYDNVNMTKVNF